MIPAFIKKIIPPTFKKKIKRFLRIFELVDIVSLIEKTEAVQVELQQLTSLIRLKNPDFPAIPPKHMQIRVAGFHYPQFFDHGKLMFDGIEDLLKPTGLSFYRFNSILDFGCGCGRFLIPMSMFIEPKKLSGTDIDKEAIDWMNEHFGSKFNKFTINGFNPPLEFANANFDFVYSISIFTHLPEDMEHAWLAELARVIKPGGHALISIHGEFYYNMLTATMHKKLLQTGFYYHAFDDTEGLPQFYQTSFHTHEYINKEWGKYFEVVNIFKQGIGGGQDAVLLRKRD